MAPVATREKLTYADYAQIPDDGQRHEILDGEHHVSPSPRARHQIVSAEMARRLGNFVHEHDLGLLLTAPFDVVLSAHDIVQPDLVFISKRHKDRMTEANLQGTPDLAVEIISPSHRRYDRETKFRRYEKLGVQEYWIVDPEAETIEVFRLEAGARPLRYRALDMPAEEVTTPLLPGLKLVGRELFAYVRRMLPR